MGIINDVVRLCWRFDVPIEKSSNRPDTWPLIKLEFDSLRNELITGDLEVRFMFMLLLRTIIEYVPN